MRLHKVRVRGLSVAFRREFSADFDELGPGLIAIVGDNGAGKTTLLEALGPATLYRWWPSYGEQFAAHVAPGVRDAVSELEFSLGGHLYRALVQADPQFGGGRGKTEAYLYRDGEPLAGPLVRDYDAAIAAILPPRELFLASAFAAQGGEGSFFSLPKAARKDLFVRMLGIEHLQRLSERARERHQAILVDLAGVEAEMSAARQAADRAAALEEELRRLNPRYLEAAQAANEADRQLREAREALSAAREEQARAKAARERWRAEHERLRREMAVLRERIERLRAERQELLDVAALRERAESAAAALGEARREMDEIRTRRDEAQRRIADLRARAARLESELTALRAEAARTKEELARARAAAEDVENARALEGEAGRLREGLVDAEATVAALTEEVARLSSQAEHERELAARRALLEQRIADLSGRASAVGSVDLTHPMCAACPLTADARGAAEALAAARAELAGLPEPTGAADSLRERQGALDQARRRRDELASRVSAVRERLAALAAARELAEREPELSRRLDEIVAAGKALRSEYDGLNAELAEREKELAELDATLAAQRARIGELEASAASLADARAASEAIARIDADLSASEQEMSADEAALARLGEEPDVPDLVGPAEQAVAEAEAAADAARKRLRDVEQEVARIEGELAAARAGAERLRELTARMDTRRRDASDWRLLEASLGRDGVQALEIAAAGPAVAAIANDLLATCYGPRFQLSLETLAPKKSGGGTKEVFDIRIIDGEAGREARQGSGGEMVVLDEALRLALAIFNSQRSGYELRTLYRDETTGALSPANADRYVAMLRRAMEIGGFEQAVIVAHQPHVWEQADAQIVLGE